MFDKSSHLPFSNLQEDIERGKRPMRYNVGKSQTLGKEETQAQEWWKPKTRIDKVETMKRYLITYSYIGTNFRGVQKQVTLEDKFKPDPLSIQGMLEICLSRFRPLTYPTVVVSSRTDSGVHALETTAHVDLELKREQKPLFLVHGMNRYFEKAKTDIRVKKIQIVPDSFHARYSAISRCYLYRLAVNKSIVSSDLPQKYSFPIPIGEWNRCYFIQNANFDINKLKEAAAFFPGVKDFRTFIGALSRKPEHFSSVRHIQEVKVDQGSPLMKPLYDSTSDMYNYWDIVVKAQSFAYRQVRRMVGVLVAAAQGKISPDEVERMIEDPINNSWNTKAQTAPPHALYLMKVEYDEKDLIIPSESENQTISENQAVSESQRDNTGDCPLRASGA